MLRLYVISTISALAVGSVHLGWSAKLARFKEEAATNQLAAVEAAVKQYKTRLSTLEQLEHETKLKLDEAKLSAVDATATNSSLQQQLSNYVRNGSSCAVDSTNTSERPAASAELAVLSDLFNRANERAEELAKIADEARVRGLACETAYKLIQQ